jgi:hypothetical protein
MGDGPGGSGGRGGVRASNLAARSERLSGGGVRGSTTQGVRASNLAAESKKAGTRSPQSEAAEAIVEAVAKAVEVQRPLPPPVPSGNARALAAEKKKRGRKSTILTSARGLDDDQLGVTRPRARNARLLGG